MTPAEQTVEVPELFVEIVVALRTNRDCVANRAGRRADDGRQISNPFIRTDPFAVLDAGVEKLPGDLAIHVNAGDHQRPEEIPLAAFIDPEMRLEHFRRVDFFVAELRFLEDLRLDLELDEFLDPLPLQQELRPLFVNRDTELVFLREEKRVWPLGEFETEIAKQSAKLRRLFSCERVSVGSHCFGRATVQRFPHQSEFCLPPSASFLVRPEPT